VHRRLDVIGNALACDFDGFVIDVTFTSDTTR